MRSRRCYCLWFPADLICTLLGNWRHHSHVALPQLDRCADPDGKAVEIPADYVVEDATYDWQRRAFGIRISHPSFPEVPEGAYCRDLYHREITVIARKIIEEPDDGSIIVEAL